MRAFRLDPTGDVGSEIQRLLAAATDGAVAALRAGDRARGVHEARKACRRCRAALWLARSDLPAPAWRPLDRAWRNAARLLGPLRDADVVPVTVSTVAGDLPGLSWVSRSGDADADAHVAAALDELGRARAAVERLPVDRVGRATIIRGFRRSWREARQAMEEAVDAREPEILHDWRKSTRRLLHHACLLVPLWAAQGRALVDELDRLQELLGAHHDLAVVGAALDRGRSSPEAAAALDRRLAERAAHLEEQAFHLARTLLALRPRVVDEALTALWDAALR